MAAPEGPVAELPPHYYRDNFQRLIDAVQGQYDDLLQPHERAFLDSWRGLGFDAQCLYVRLVSRVGPWFRESRLNYPELGSLDAALGELLRRGLAVAAVELEEGEIAGLFTRDELAAAGGCGGNKAAVLASRDRAGWNALLPELEPGRIAAPTHSDTVALLQLLFFGNRYQGMVDFVLSDLGVACYYPYRLDKSQRLFPHRESLDEYVGLAQLADACRELEESGDLAAMELLAGQLLASEPQFDAGRPRWDKLCNRLARHQERAGNTGLALSLYRRSAAHPARERSARLMERRGEYAEALALTEVIGRAPWCEEELEAAGRIGPRVRRKLEGGRLARRRDSFERSDLVISAGDGPVELQVAAHIAPDWASVHYVENQLMNALFGLAFWEVIFAPVPGAFHSPYQSAPGDMYDSGFAERRRVLVDRRLEELQALDLAQALPEAWRRYRGYQSRWVNWRYVDERLVTDASRIILGGQLLAIWRHMLFDPRENRRGFPDLLALGSDPGDYRLIEVKGPGDALQDNQKRWLRRFQAIGVPAEVAWVSWGDA